MTTEPNKNNTIELVKVTNPFDRRQKTVTIEPFHGRYLDELITEVIPEGVEIVVSINGKTITRDLWYKIIPKTGDQICVIPIVQGGGGDGKAVLNIAAMIAIAVVAPYAAAGMGFAAGTLGGAVIAATITAAGGMLIGALTPRPSSPQLDYTESEVSQTFGWNPQTRQRQGIPIPVFYGTNRLYGNIIATHTSPTTDNNEQQLNVLLSLGQGPIKGISDLQISDQPIENFANVDYEFRQGNLTQTVIEEFNQTKIEFTPNLEVVHDTPITYTTVDNDFDKLEVDIVFPYGLYLVLNNGAFYQNEVEFLLEYKKTTDGSYTTYQPTADYTITSITIPRGVYQSSIYPFLYIDEALSRFKAGDSVTISDVVGMTELNGNTYTVLAVNWAGIYLNVDASGFTTYESGGTATVDIDRITGNTSGNVRRTFVIDVERGSDYDIKLTKITEDRVGTDGEPDARYGDRMFLGTVREVEEADYTYPRTALVSLTAVATNQLSGGLKFNCLAECKYVRTYDGTNWGVEFSSNPAWVIFDLLTQPVYSGSVAYTPTASPPANAYTVERYDGINPSRIDIDKFWELAQYCDDTVYGGAKRHTFNGGFDSQTNMQDAILKVCETCRCVPIWNGTQLTLAIDKAIANPVQLFTVGNTNRDSFKLTYLPKEDRASEIDINFLDAENDYQRTPFSIHHPDLTNTSNKVTLDLFGITSADEAWRAGMFRLEQNKRLVRTCELGVDIDALHCTIGDVVAIQNDVPQWGNGGRVKGGGSSYVLIDTDWTFDDSNTYEIQVRHPSDVIDTRTVHAGYTCLSQLIIDPSILLSGDQTAYFSAGDRVTVSGGLGPSTDIYELLDVTYSGGQTRLYLDIDLWGDTDTEDGIVQNLSRVRVTSAFSATPSADQVYAIGAENLVTRDYRIIGLRKTSDQQVTFTAIEYDPDIYDIDDVEPSSIEPSTPPTASTLIVADLTLREIAEINDSGVISRSISVTYRLPTAGIFDHVNIYYRIGGTPNWVLAGRTSQNRFVITPVLASTVYEVRVVAVDIFGKSAEITASPSETITTGSTADFDGSYLQTRVTGLELKGQGNSTEFTGKDIYFVWRDVMAVNETYPAGEEPNGAGSSTPNTWLKDYEVKIYNDAGSLRRTDYVTKPEYTYSFERNWNDGYGTPIRTVKIEIRARDRYFRVSASPASITVVNPAPVQVTDVTATGYNQTVVIDWGEVVDTDLQGYLVWGATSSGFTPGESNLIYRGQGTVFNHVTSSYVEHFYRVAAYDAFGEASLNYSAEVSATPTLSTGQLTDYDLEAPFLSGVTFETSDSGCYWSAGTLVYGSQEVVVSARLSGAATTYKYIYADLSGTISNPLTLSTSNTKPTIGADTWLFAINEYNASWTPDYKVWPCWQSRIIHAALLQADTITADLIGAGQIQAGHLAAGSINASTIFVSNVIPSSAANFNYAAASSKGGAATSLVDQGDLATQDRSDLDYTDGADVTASNTSADTAAVNGVAAATISQGAARANAGLGATGQLVSNIICANTVTMTGLAAGLYLDAAKMGYWDGTNWKSYIDSSGNAVFEKSLSVGVLTSNEGMQILSTSSGVATLKAQKIVGANYITTLIDGEGLKLYSHTSFSTSSSYLAGQIGGAFSTLYFDTISSGDISAGLKSTYFAMDSGYIGQKTNHHLTYTRETAGGADSTVSVDIPPACLSFGSTGKTVATRFYDSGWLNKIGDGWGNNQYTSTSYFNHGLGAVPNFVIGWVRDHTNPQYMTILQMQAYNQATGSWINEVDATRVRVKTGITYPLTYYNGSAVYSSAVDVRIMAWL